jgi:hypothetical protein
MAKKRGSKKCNSNKNIKSKKICTESSKKAERFKNTDNKRSPKKVIYLQNVFTESEDQPKGTLKFLKILGYCPVEGCGCTITDSDFIEGKKTLVRCIRCNNRCRISQLLENNSKKEHAQNVIDKSELLKNISYKPIKHDVGIDYVPDFPDEFKNIKVTEDEW